jgi:hypothetical protein
MTAHQRRKQREPFATDSSRMIILERALENVLLQFRPAHTVHQVVLLSKYRQRVNWATALLIRPQALGEVCVSVRISYVTTVLHPLSPWREKRHDERAPDDRTSVKMEWRGSR